MNERLVFVGVWGKFEVSYHAFHGFLARFGEEKNLGFSASGCSIEMDLKFFLRL